MYLISIETKTMAFYNPNGMLDPAAEIASILEHLALQLRDGELGHGRLYDTNGNAVGTYLYQDLS